MLYFILLSALVTWLASFVFWLARYPNLLLRATRWAINVWMLVFGLMALRATVAGYALVEEALRDEYPDPGTIFIGFYAWYAVVSLSVVYKGLLAIALPVMVAVLVACPQVRTLMDYGLVRLGWLDWVYNPVFTLFAEVVLGLGRTHRPG
ncbi:hypothetical protein F5Y11DRAFT_351140 [Daldinia sp. FL1419]|nr:hypothetical protein F5Y11DRAFT_351140 [Daldinia sp. FL1419]